MSEPTGAQDVGAREVADYVWLVSFMHSDQGFFDHESGRVECAPNPFAAKVLPMSPEWTSEEVVGVTGFEPATPTSRT